MFIYLMVLKLFKKNAYFCKIIQTVVGHITNWLKTYIAESKTKGFVVGISGGIDSAVTSTLCAKTESVYCALRCQYIKRHSTRIGLKNI